MKFDELHYKNGDALLGFQSAVLWKRSAQHWTQLSRHPEGFKRIESLATFYFPSFRRKPESRRLFELTEANLDAGFRRHDDEM